MPLYDRDYMRNPQRSEPSWLSRWTPLQWIIALNLIVFLMQHVIGVGVDDLQMPMGGVSLRALSEGKVWTALTYMFVHEGPWHLIGNLLLIGFIGQRLQGLIGAKQFVLLYFFAGLVGAGLQLVVQSLAHTEPGPVIIGASACGFGLLMAYAAIMPEERISFLLYFIIPITGRIGTLALVLLGVDAALGVSALVWPSAAAIWGHGAYFAHVGGGILGWYFVRMLGFSGFSIDREHLISQRLGARRPQRRQQVARVRRERAMPDVDLDAMERRRRAEPGKVREAPVMEDVNEILDKINREGMGSLNDDERRRLEAASREIARKERSGRA